MIKWRRCLPALLAAGTLLQSGCSTDEMTSSTGGDALTWGTWGNYGRYQQFVELVERECPDIKMEFISYTGSNSTSYSWEQMRADDISDIFITSQILDEELAKERLVDLSGYSFVNGFSTSTLDQVSVDGGIYLLPASYAIYGIYYNKTLMEENGWEVPSDADQLEALCEEIREAGLIPGVVGTQLAGGPFSTVFNLAKTGWLTTPDGIQWERNFLAGNADAAGMWEGTMDYVSRYMDMGMFYTDPEDRNNPELIMDYLGQRKAVFFTAVQTVNITEFPETGDELEIMPFISEDGSKNIYMYNPTFYFGISRRLTEPGNEKKLEHALRILSLLFSEKGQAEFVDETTPCVMSALDNTVIPENSMTYDARTALKDGRAFPMTYTGWEHILSSIGQAYKEWFRGENDMDGSRCIARMDELCKEYLNHSEEVYMCESTANFSLEETGKLVGKALGSFSGADAVLVPLGSFHEGGVELRPGITGKLYAGRLNVDIVNTICPSMDGQYAMMTMTGAQVRELAQKGFDAAGDGHPFSYLLVTRGDAELKDDTAYQVAFLMKGYTEETAEKYGAQIHEESLKRILCIWLEDQKTVSPDGNPWE